MTNSAVLGIGQTADETLGAQDMRNGLEELVP